MSTGYHLTVRGHVAQKPRLFDLQNGVGCEVRVKYDNEYIDRETGELKTGTRYVGFKTYDNVIALAVEAQLGTGDFVELTASEDYADLWVDKKTNEIKRKSVAHVLSGLKVLRKAGQRPEAAGEGDDAAREAESRVLAGVS